MQHPIPTVKEPIHTKIHLPGSKSITLRALLLTAMAEGVSELNNLSITQSTKTLINALHQLGIVTQLDESVNTCIVAGGNGRFPKKQATIWCDKSTIVARFLMAACAITQGVYYFDADPILRTSTIMPLIDVIRRQGGQFIPTDAHKMPLTLVGADTLEGGEIIFTEETNLQIIAALLMVSPFARSPFTFKLPHHKNLATVDITIAMMAEFGVLVHHLHHGQLMAPVPQRYHAKDYTIEPDFGLAAYFFAAAAITQGELTIQPVKRAQCKQPNVKFLSVLEKMGCRVLETHHGLTIRGGDLQGIEVSMGEFSDTFLALIAIAPFAKSPTRISHLGKLNRKEKSYLNIMMIELSKMGIHIEHGENWIKIFPSNPQGGIVETYQDPHLAMAFAVIGLKVPGIILDEDETLLNYFPEFFKLWNKLTEHININA